MPPTPRTPRGGRPPLHPQSPTSPHAAPPTSPRHRAAPETNGGAPPPARCAVAAVWRGLGGVWLLWQFWQFIDKPFNVVRDAGLFRGTLSIQLPMYMSAVCRQPQRQPRLQLPPMPQLPPPGQMLQAALGPTQHVAHFVMSTPLHLLAIALQTAQHAADGMTDGALAC